MQNQHRLRFAVLFVIGEVRFHQAKDFGNHLQVNFGGKSAEMIKPAEAERVSGYKVGGISPFGQMRKPPTAIEEQSMAHGFVFINGGQRGLQVELDPNDAVKVLGAIARPLIA